jgi:hypothetical protein
VTTHRKIINIRLLFGYGEFCVIHSSVQPAAFHWPMTQPYDVIFIGSGIGSLAAASLLSQWEIGLRGSDLRAHLAAVAFVEAVEACVRRQ